MCAPPAILARMKIVVLDGYTLNPGDLSWDDIKGLGETERGANAYGALWQDVSRRESDR